jgi:integrase
MNDLIRVDDIPGYHRLLEEIENRVFGNVKDWDEFELRFLRGEGLKETTYVNLKSGIRQFFDTFLDMGVSPFRVTISMIEKFYDEVSRTKSPQTASVRITQLKQFYRKFCEMYPLCRNPFKDMNEKLRRKFKDPVREKAEVRYLRREELERLFAFLEALGDIRSFYMLVLTKFLFFTGLRISETLQIQGKLLEQFDDYGEKRWRCWFIGKARENYSSQLVPDSCVELMRELWDRHFGRQFGPEEYVWFHLPTLYPTKSHRTSTRMGSSDAWRLYVDLSEMVNYSGLFPFQVKLHPHYFRHNLAVYLSEELRRTPREVQLILRHRDIGTTTGMYYHDKPMKPEVFVF